MYNSLIENLGDTSLKKSVFGKKNRFFCEYHKDCKRYKKKCFVFSSFGFYNCAAKFKKMLNFLIFLLLYVIIFINFKIFVMIKIENAYQKTRRALENA